MDFGKLVARIKGILLAPNTEWPKAAAEADSVRGLFVPYILVVAALPVIAVFIRRSMIGYTLYGTTFRVSFGHGIGALILGYILSLVLTYVMALVINALAPGFGGQQNQVQALKTTAYAWTANWIAGIAVIVPWIGWLIMLIGAIYAIYLLYRGLPHTMKCPPERAAGYAAVSVVIAIVLTWIVAAIVGVSIGSAALRGM